MSEGQVVGTISIKVTPDTSKFRRELREELAAIERNEEATVKVKADFDKDGLTEKVKAAAKEADATAHVKVDVDKRGDLIHDLDNVRREVEQRLDKPAAIKLGVSPESEYRIRQALARLKPKIEPEISESFFARMRNRISGIFGGGGKGPGGPSGFTGGGFGGSGIASQLFNFGSLPNLIGLLTLLPPALAIAAPALASIPALLAGVAAPIGVMALGLSGFKKAAEDSGLAGVDKKGKLTVGPALKAIQDQVSEVFAKGFTPILKQLLSVSPQATTAMKGIAQGIVTLAQGVTNTLTSPAVMDQLSRLFQNIGNAIGGSAPGLSAFTTGLVNLATNVSNHFPGLANWFNEMGTKFSGWVDKISADGTLDKAISSLRPVLDNVVGFVGKLFDAGIKFASDPQMVENISTLLNSITDLTVKALPPLADAFKGLAWSIGKIVDLLPDTKTDNSLRPGTPSWWTGKDAPQKSWAQRNLPFQDSGLQPDWEKKAEQWEKDHIDGPIGRFFTGNNQWEKKIGDIPNTLDGLTNPGGNLNIAGFNIPTGQITQQVQGAVDTAINAFKSIPGAVSGIWDTVVSAASSAMSQFGSAVSRGIDTAVSFFTSLPGKAVAAVESMGSQLFSAGAAAMNKLNEGLKSVPIIGPVVSGLEGILKNIPHSPAEEGPMSGAGWNALFTGGQAIGNQFKTGLEDGFQGVIQSATSLLGEVHDAMTKGFVPDNLRKNVSTELKAIGQEYDELRVKRDALDPKDKAGRQSISDQMKQLQTLRDQLKLDRDKFPDKSKPNAKKGMDINQVFGQELQKLPSIGTNFAMANINQFEQDLGISGRGAIPTIANIGVQWASQLASNAIGLGFGNGGMRGGDTHIHVSSVDEAMAVKQAEKNRQAMTYAGR